MDKMKMETAELTSKNIEKIGELFPNCITENKDENGKLKKAINFELLKQMLSDEVIDGDEAYEFTWVGKKDSITEANKPTRKTLRPCKEESKNWDTTENLYIEGDNLEVLKLLQESYLGKVKIIYIDPPYNTGNDFIYNDDFKITKEDYADEIGVLDEYGNRMFKNTDSNGRFHSDWCSMIYPRLILARNLLSDDGVIFISIDDNELENLLKICTEIFGESNKINTFVWIKKKKGSHLSKTTRSMTEYIVCFAKNIKNAELFGEKAYSDKRQPLAKRTNSIKTLVFPQNSVAANLKDGTYKGVYGKGSSSISFEEFKVKDNIVITKCIAEGPFIWTQGKLDEEIRLGSKIFLSSQFGFNVLRSDQDDKIKRPSTLIDNSIGVGTNEDAYNEAKDIFGEEGIMSYPKPLSLMEYIINTITFFDKNSIILDFFSGSATTAHAVMQLNAADGGNRKYIMVQIPEETASNSIANKRGFKNICEIGKERLRRAGDSIKFETGAVIDDGFRVLKLDDTNMRDVFYSANQYNQGMLTSLESNIKPDRTSLDLLFGCLLEWGLPLSMPYTPEEIEGHIIHTYNEGDLIACFDENISVSIIKTIAKRNPIRVVFRDNSFSNSPSKINVTEIFKSISPETTVKVI